MSNEVKQLYSRYYYNAVIEFVYFTILYIETYGTASQNNLIKHVKFFKKEVTEFICSFEGKTLKDKLFQLLNTLDCFDLHDNKVKVNENNLKNVCLADLVLSKSADLILKGITNIDEVCKRLNYNSVVKIDKNHLLRVIKKYSFISANNETLSLNHAHGLLGFEDNLYNSVINYFYEILFRGKILSVKEIKNHGNLLKFCGLQNVMATLAILNSSDHFTCQNGYVLINKKSKKYPKKKLIDSELIKSKFLSRSLPISQVVFNMYGHFLYKWSGEIGNLTKSSGNICCVVDFINGQQGVFNVCFNVAALKIISEIDNLKNYVNMRDKVEFNALYYVGKKLDRCWRATSVRLLSNTKLEYDEVLERKLTKDTDMYRDKCIRCSSSVNIFPNAKKPKLHEQFSNKTSDYDSLSDSLSEQDTANRSTKENEAVKSAHLESLTNLRIPEYVVMFGYVHVLMEDKAIAIATHEDKIYNILFLKASAHAPNGRKEDFTKGQKVIAFVPIIDKLEAFCVATLVSGLGNGAKKETDKSNSLPVELAGDLFLKKAVGNLCCKFCVNYSEIFSRSLLMERFMNDLKLKLELSSLFSLISNQNKMRSQNYLLRFLYSISKMNCNRLSCDSRVSNFVVQLSKSLVQKRNKRKPKLIEDEHGLEVDILPAEFCLTPLAITATNETNVPKSNSSSKYNSLDAMQGSLTSLNSFKTCASNDSFESYYSSEDKTFPKCLSDSSACEESSKFSSSQLLHNDIRSDLESNCNGSSSKNLEKPDLPNQPKYLPDSSVNEAGSNILPRQLLQSDIRSGIEFDCIESSSTKFEKPDSSKQPINFEEKIQDISDENDLPIMPSQCQLQNKCDKNYDSNDHKYLSLQSVPCLKSHVKKNKVIFPCLLKSLCGKCSLSSFDVKAHVSVITNAFIFLTTDINGQNVVLPVSKQNVPTSLKEKMKLYSCCEITVIPAIILNLSHVVEVRFI